MQAQLTITNRALADAQHSSAVATDQTWQAIGNINWLARLMDESLQQTVRAINQTSAQLAFQHQSFQIEQRPYIVNVSITFSDINSRPLASPIQR